MELSASDTLILFSPVSVAELWAGARVSECEKLEPVFGALIAASAIGSGATLWTRNRTHYPMNELTFLD